MALAKLFLSDDKGEQRKHPIIDFIPWWHQPLQKPLPGKIIPQSSVAQWPSSPRQHRDRQPFYSVPCLLVNLVNWYDMLYITSYKDTTIHLSTCYLFVASKILVLGVESHFSGSTLWFFLTHLFFFAIHCFVFWNSFFFSHSIEHCNPQEWISNWKFVKTLPTLLQASHTWHTRPLLTNNPFLVILACIAMPFSMASPLPHVFKLHTNETAYADMPSNCKCSKQFSASLPSLCSAYCAICVLHKTTSRIGCLSQTSTFASKSHWALISTRVSQEDLSCLQLLWCHKLSRCKEM